MAARKRPPGPSKAAVVEKPEAPSGKDVKVAIQAVGQQLVKNPEDMGRISGMIEAGVHPATACKSVGVNPARFREWIRRGEDDDMRESETPYAAFYRMVSVCASRAESRMVTAVATSDDWKAQAWLLKALNPDVYGDKRQVQHTGPAGGAIEVAIQSMTETEIRARVVQLQQELNALPPPAPEGELVDEAEPKE